MQKESNTRGLRNAERARKIITKILISAIVSCSGGGWGLWAVRVLYRCSSAFTLSGLAFFHLLPETGSWFGIPPWVNTTTWCHHMVPSWSYLRDAPIGLWHSAVLLCMSAFSPLIWPMRSSTPAWMLMRMPPWRTTNEYLFTNKLLGLVTTRDPGVCDSVGYGSVHKRQSKQVDLLPKSSNKWGCCCSCVFTEFKKTLYDQ